jgi:cell division protein FtsI (penicillin-binding protein 3)
MKTSEKCASFCLYSNLSKLFFASAIFAAAAIFAGCASPFAKNGESKAEQIQKITNEIVEASKKKLKPKGLCAIVADPHTGKILALEGNAIRFLTEPVSTFKPVSVVAGLEEGKITPRTKINCEYGAYNFGKITIKDYIPLGELTYKEVLAQSSNIGITKIAYLLKDEEFYDWSRKFGLGERSGISVPGELPGILNPPFRWSSQTKARMAIGQNIAATPLQIAMAYCALANGGNLMRPVLGQEKTQTIRRVCSKKTANLVKKALQASTETTSGAARFAQVKGLSVAGSTGTAQAVSDKGEYTPGKYVTMFAGFFPADHPKYVVVVVIDEADLSPRLNYGGLVAAPIFAEIAKKISKLPSK